jgi:hypothetical protein
VVEQKSSDAHSENEHRLTLLVVSTATSVQGKTLSALWKPRWALY